VPQPTASPLNPLHILITKYKSAVELNCSVSKIAEKKTYIHEKWVSKGNQSYSNITDKSMNTKLIKSTEM
jgi:hypothetical protein